MVSSVEAPFALFEEPVEVLWLDAVESAEVSFRSVPEVLDSVDVATSMSEEFGVVDAVMMKVAQIQRIVAVEGIGVDDTVRGYALLDDRQDALGASIWDNGRENLPTPLQQPKDSDFPGGSSTPLSFASASKVALIGFYFARELVAS